MQKGADINGDIITNPHADVPPVITQKEEEDDNNVTASYSLYYDSDDEEEDHSEAVKKRRERLYEILRKLKRKPIWKWHRRHYPTPWKPGSKGHAIFQVGINCFLWISLGNDYEVCQLANVNFLSKFIKLHIEKFPVLANVISYLNLSN